MNISDFINESVDMADGDWRNLALLGMMCLVICTAFVWVPLAAIWGMGYFIYLCLKNLVDNILP